MTLIRRTPAALHRRRSETPQRGRHRRCRPSDRSRVIDHADVIDVTAIPSASVRTMTATSHGRAADGHACRRSCKSASKPPRDSLLQRVHHHPPARTSAPSASDIHHPSRPISLTAFTADCVRREPRACSGYREELRRHADGFSAPCAAPPTAASARTGPPLDDVDHRQHLRVAGCT